MGDDQAAALLRDARQLSGLTQLELAIRAQVTQSVISIYESGRRQPALPTLAALVEATGYELDIRIRAIPQRLRVLSGPIGRRVLHHRGELVAAAAKHGITNLRVFGSVARGEDRPDSDVDLLADLSPETGLLSLGKVRTHLESILEAPVDLVPAAGLKPDVHRSVDADLIPL